jgi:hypothetical protein
MKKIFISSQSYVPFHVGSEASGKIWLSLLRLPSLDHLLLQAYSSSLRRHFMASQPTNDEDQQPLSFPTSLISPLCSVIYTLSLPPDPRDSLDPRVPPTGHATARELLLALSLVSREFYYTARSASDPACGRQGSEGRKEGRSRNVCLLFSLFSFLSFSPSYALPLCDRKDLGYGERSVCPDLEAGSGSSERLAQTKQPKTSFSSKKVSQAKDPTSISSNPPLLTPLAPARGIRRRRARRQSIRA